jgi:tRNA threonylcarbamoyladenosine biosynthesis protein TsaE
MPVRTITTEEELMTIAEEVLSVLPQKEGAHVVALRGELGAGKTAFVKALAGHLGIVEHVTSPTFVLMKHYAVPGHENFKILTHIDAYRIEDTDELKVLRLDELYRDTGRLIAIEWPERMGEYASRDALNMELVINDDNTRTVTYGD